MAAEVSLPVWLLCDPLRGRQVSPVSVRYPSAARSRMASKASRRSPRFWTRSVRSSSSRDLISEPSCPGRGLSSRARSCRCRGRGAGPGRAAYSRSPRAGSRVRRRAACRPVRRRRPGCGWLPRSRQAPRSSFQISRLSNSSGPGVAPNRAACSQAIAVCDVSVLMTFCMILSNAMLLSSEAGCPVVMTLCFTRSQRSHDGRNACAGGMREWCGRRERSD